MTLLAPIAQLISHWGDHEYATLQQLSNSNRKTSRIRNINVPRRLQIWAFSAASGLQKARIYSWPCFPTFGSLLSLKNTGALCIEDMSNQELTSGGISSNCCKIIDLQQHCPIAWCWNLLGLCNFDNVTQTKDFLQHHIKRAIRKELAKKFIKLCPRTRFIVLN